MKKVLKIIAGVAVILLIFVLVYAKSNSISPLGWHMHDQVFNEDGVALRGYDAVAYFKQGDAILGEEALKHQWNGADWWFSSKENLEAFQSNPQAYAPQYGGYCSFAVSTGFTAHIDPMSWEIVDNKLYVFSNGEVRTEWKKKIDQGVIATCDQNWSK